MKLMRFFRLRHFSRCIYCYFSDALVIKKYPLIVKSQTILIVKLEAIGDYILFRNFIQYLKKSDLFRHYQITLCGNIIWKDLANSYDLAYVDNFIWIDKKKFAIETHYRAIILKQIAEAGFEYAVQSNFSREFLWGDSIIRASNAKFKIGFKGDLANDLWIFNWISTKWYNKLFKNNNIPVFEFDKNRLFFEELIQQKINLRKPFFKLSPKVKEDYLVVFPGAGEKIKQWPAKKFAELITKFRETNNNPIFICGAKSDQIIAQEIIDYCSGIQSIKDFCGKTNLPQLVELIQSAKLLLTNDSSAFHIAAATETNTVCLLMGRHFGRFAPYPNTVCNYIEYIYPSGFYNLISKSKNLVEQTKYDSDFSINEIKVEQVLKAVLERIK